MSSLFWDVTKPCNIPEDRRPQEHSLLGRDTFWHEEITIVWEKSGASIFNRAIRLQIAEDRNLHMTLGWRENYLNHTHYRLHVISMVWFMAMYRQNRLQDLIQKFRTLKLQQEKVNVLHSWVRNFPPVNERDAEYRLSRLRITFEESLYKHQRQTLLSATAHKHKYNTYMYMPLCRILQPKRNWISTGA